MNDNFIEISKDVIINSHYIVQIAKEQRTTPHFEVIEGEFDYYIIVRNIGVVKITKDKFIEIKKILLNENK